jgi:hypothetical protein
MMNVLYGLGMPSMSGDSIYKDRFMQNLTAGKDPFSGFPAHMRGGRGQAARQPQQPQNQNQGINWQFPQYASTWAFTPPPAFPVTPPPQFKKK